MEPIDDSDSSLNLNAATADVQRQHQSDQELIQALQAGMELDREKIENLKLALLTSRRIGAAIGVLMNSRKITEAAAFDLLSSASQRTHRKLRDVAQYVLDTGTLP